MDSLATISKCNKNNVKRMSINELDDILLFLWKKEESLSI